MLYLVANWKSHKTHTEAQEWIEEMQTLQLTTLVQVVVCPPLPYLIPLAEMVEKRRLAVLMGVQDVSAFPLGAYTGAVSAEMIKEWAKFAIVGHSERREYFHETHQQVANKVERCVENNLTPIVCVDEPYAERQIAAIRDEYLQRCVFAYEPLEAIGTGTPDKPEHAQQVIEGIREKLPEGVPVVYGGSLTAVNVAEYVNDTVSDGALVGGASLDAEEWKAMVMEVA